MTRVLAYVPDLMDRSRITAARAEVTFAPSPAALVAAVAAAAEVGSGRDSAAGAGPDVVVVVDLGRPGVLAAVGQIVQLAHAGVPVIGFASHVDRELLAAARAAGCTTVLARSAFFSRVGPLLSDLPPDR